MDTISGTFVEDGSVRSDGLHIFARKEFAQNRFDYKAGQHVIFGGPSTRGKTRLSFELLQYIVSPDLPALVAVSKPDDPETSRWGTRLHFRRVETWPPSKKMSEVEWLGGRRPNGYLIWPKFGDIRADSVNASQITADLLAHTYANGVNHKHAILVMDDTMVKAKVLNLDGDMVTILAMAGAMGIGLWLFVQKPTDSGRTTLWGFENATHYFFTAGSEARMLQRYVEIAGDKGPIIRRVLPTLKPFQFLYLQKYSGHMCIVDAS
jgi:hypothetical protein